MAKDAARSKVINDRVDRYVQGLEDMPDLKVVAAALSVSLKEVEEFAVAWRERRRTFRLVEQLRGDERARWRFVAVCRACWDPAQIGLVPEVTFQLSDGVITMTIRCPCTKHEPRGVVSDVQTVADVARTIINWHTLNWHDNESVAQMVQNLDVRAAQTIYTRHKDAVGLVDELEDFVTTLPSTEKPQLERPHQMEDSTPQTQPVPSIYYPPVVPPETIFNLILYNPEKGCNEEAVAIKRWGEVQISKYWRKRIGETAVKFWQVVADVYARLPPPCSRKQEAIIKFCLEKKMPLSEFDQHYLAVPVVTDCWQGEWRIVSIDAYLLGAV